MIQMIRTVIIIHTIHTIMIYNTLLGGRWICTGIIYTRPPSKINYSLINAVFFFREYMRVNQ